MRDGGWHSPRQYRSTSRRRCAAVFANLRSVAPQLRLSWAAPRQLRRGHRRIRPRRPPLQRRRPPTGWRITRHLQMAFAVASLALTSLAADCHAGWSAPSQKAVTAICFCYCKCIVAGHERRGRIQCLLKHHRTIIWRVCEHQVVAVCHDWTARFTSLYTSHNFWCAAAVLLRCMSARRSFQQAWLDRCSSARRLPGRCGHSGNRDAGHRSQLRERGGAGGGLVSACPVWWVGGC